MRRVWFVLRVLAFNTLPSAIVLGTPAGAFGALLGGLIAAGSAGRLSVPAGIAIGAAIGFGSMSLFVAAVQFPLLAYMLVTHFARTNSLEPRPRRRVRLNVPPAKALLVCREAALQIPHAAIDPANCSNDCVAAATPLTWTSWGEKIRFDVRAAPADRSDVVVSSRPALLTVQIDYGTNEGYVETAIAYLRKAGLLVEESGEEAAPSPDSERTR